MEKSYDSRVAGMLQLFCRLTSRAYQQEPTVETLGAWQYALARWNSYAGRL